MRRSLKFTPIARRRDTTVSTDTFNIRASCLPEIDEFLYKALSAGRSAVIRVSSVCTSSLAIDSLAGWIWKRERMLSMFRRESQSVGGGICQRWICSTGKFISSKSQETSANQIAILRCGKRSLSKVSACRNEMQSLPISALTGPEVHM